MTDLENGLWLSISEIADETGVSHQAVSKRVGALEAEGQLKSRRGDNGRKEVNLAQYMVAIRAVGDPAREQALETRRALKAAKRDQAGAVNRLDPDITFINVVDFIIACKEDGDPIDELQYLLARQVCALRARLKQLMAEAAKPCDVDLPF